MPIRNAMPDLNRKLQFFPSQNKTPKKLSEEQVQQYNREGYICPLDVFSAGEINLHRTYFDQLIDKAMKAGWNSYSINGWQAKCVGIYDLVNEPRILDYVQDLIGENLICWATHYFCKLPGDTKRVSWHQDASYWPLSPSKTVTVWLAIDDADVENGAMQIIPRSHRHGQIDFEESKAEEQNVLNQTVKEPTSYGLPPVALEMKAGQISLHSDLLLHGSEPNTSDRRRCGLTMRFIPPEVRASNRRNQNSIIVRGIDSDNHWFAASRPEFDQIPSKN